MDSNTNSLEGESPVAARRPAESLPGLRPPSKPRVTRETVFTHIRTAFRQPFLWLTLALIFTVMEGALRKWIGPFKGGPGEILAYFSKDILFGIGLALTMGRRPSFLAGLSTFKHWLTMSILFTVAGILTSLGPDVNVTGTVLSLRALIILPLMALIFSAGMRGFPLEGFAIVAVVFVAGNAALALLQSTLPPFHILNKYADDSMFVAEVETGVRATGTFAYITGLSIVSAVGVWAGMVLISLRRSQFHILIGVLGILCGLTCAFASVSRSAVLTAGAMLAIWVLMGAGRFKIVFGLTVATGAIAAGLAIFYPTVLQRFDNVREGTFDRFETAGDDNTDRAFGQWTELAGAIAENPMGSGIGSEQTGTNYVQVGRRGFTSYESQFPRIVAEIGIFGIIGFFLLVGSVVLGLQKLKGGKEQRQWGMAVLATQVFVLGIAYGSLAFNHTASAFVWIIVTVVFSAAQVSKVQMQKGEVPTRAHLGTNPIPPRPGKEARL